MRFEYALHMHHQNLVLLSCLYAKPFELVIEIVLHYSTSPLCHKINLFKRSFWGSRFERLDDAFIKAILVSPTRSILLAHCAFDVALSPSRFPAH